MHLKAATTYHKGGVCAQFGIIEAGNLCRNGIHGLPRVQLLRVWVHLKRNFYWESTICVAIRDGVFSRPEFLLPIAVMLFEKKLGIFSGARRVVACLDCELCSKDSTVPSNSLPALQVQRYKSNVLIPCSVWIQAEFPMIPVAKN
jgi:hypothetical protein